MIFRRFPWKFILKRISRAHGFADPIAILNQFNRFSRPSEVILPTELLRAGLLFQARGILNSQVIQNNLDWIWPYWTEQQFDPRSVFFIPRSFLISHINLNHRNWIAAGIPNCSYMPVVDPRGLVMPYFDSWSVDFWIMNDKGDMIIPSKHNSTEQQIHIEKNLCIITQTSSNDLSLKTRTEVILHANTPTCRIHVWGKAATRAWLIVAVRPYNPEGISFIDTVSFDFQKKELLINKQDTIRFDTSPQFHLLSCYQQGDVFHRVKKRQFENDTSVVCKSGMTTSAALFDLGPKNENTIQIDIPSNKHMFQEPAETSRLTRRKSFTENWEQLLSGTCTLNIPDKKMQFLFNNAVRTILLHSPDDVYAGPFTYKRFWFRDAALIAHAMVYCGLWDRIDRMLELFASRQTISGYFMSQEGEWDSNGQVLWIINKFRKTAQIRLPAQWKKLIEKGAQWIKSKRLSPRSKEPHAGMMPAGFSAEHLGPNDHYYWDNFWSVAGLHSAAELLHAFSDTKSAKIFENEAVLLSESIERSLQKVEKRLGVPIIPASVHRRMDSGAVGSLVASYPLHLFAPDDKRVINTVNYLLDNCMIDNGFFHDISHSGINPYLTLHIAQTLLRNNDRRFFPLMETIARLASPTGQWPEAIHPQFGSGCMGDGQHVWAAAEWILMIQYCFVREEEHRNALILCSGIPSQWLTPNSHLSYGPTRTSLGNLSLSIEAGEDYYQINWDAQWHNHEPLIEIHLLPDHIHTVTQGETSIRLPRHKET